MKRVLLVAHISELPGPVQLLSDYFQQQSADFYRMYFPIDGVKIYQSSFYHGQHLLVKKKSKTMGARRYLSDLGRTLIWIGKIPKPIDKAVGTNCLAVLPLIVFKKFLRIRQVVFFTSDFARRRFANRFQNWLYVALDKFCALRADKVCCNSQRTLKARASEGVPTAKMVHTPNGVYFKEIGRIDYRQKKFSRKILFIGYISPERGLQNIIKLLPKIKIKLEVIGSGQYEGELKKLARSLKISHRVKFMGLKPHPAVIAYLKKFSGFGLAPYSLKGDDTDWIKYCDPIKVKEYLACFIPVIISDMPEIASQIREKKLGYVYQNEKEARQILKKIAFLGENDYRQMLKNIAQVRDNFDLTNIYNRV
ncbi:MAG: glycosyltransferase [Candidatus Pacebacteria bacterium]|nr:glycosyltransferase [Candidatus Paceibacterota bacterium]